MLRHSIYSVRDKKKVDAEVIDIREIKSAKGVRFQIVGIHPEDGTTVTTFCSASVAEDYRQKLDAIPQEMSAENIVLAQDHIPESEATVVSTDGTPIDDDLETFVEDPLVGSPSEGTLTSAKVMAAEGESEEKNCGCGQDPCKTYGAEGVSKDTKSKFKGTETSSLGITINGDWAGGSDGVAAINIKLDPYQTVMTEDMSGTSTNDAQGLFEEIVNEGRKPKEVIDEWISGWAGDDWRKELDEGTSGFASETVAGIDVQTPSQIAIETPDSDELIVPDPDHLVSGDGHVIGQQTGKVNTTPMHAEDWGEGMPIPHQAILLSKMTWKEVDTYTGYGDDLFEWHDEWDGKSQSQRQAYVLKVLTDAYGAEVHVDGDDFGDEQLLKVARMDIDNHIDNGTFYVLGEEPQAFHDGELDGENFYTIVSLYSQHHEDEDKAETILTNMFKREYPQYLGEDEEDIKSAEGDDYEYYEAPGLAGNKRVLIPTAVIGGLALAYLAKPELLSGSFDKISEMLGKLTKKGDKTE